MTEPDSFQTLHQLRTMLESAGRRPNRKWGQHFLIDRNLMRKLVESAELCPADCVLEVGAGTGSLTGLLAARAGAVVAVEIDPHLTGLLRENLSRQPNVTILHTDALAKKSEVAKELMDELGAACARLGGTLKLVANLPYDIATPLIVNLMVSPRQFERFCFTVQREVGDRFLAEPGAKDYGPISIVTQVLAEARRIGHAGPECFWPQPKVESSMIALKSRVGASIAQPDAAGFLSFVRKFFLHRRKTLRHVGRTLASPQRLAEALAALQIRADARPESIDPEKWAQLYLACR